ncbi:MAG: large conductance mechanosensitive channel protein MscL [Ruminococcus sp.]|nr:large conductance mechanosensitive channel protein MscL [Ruminococcus sp.]
MKKFFAEFKEFIMRGNVMDLAVAVIIGGAFQSIVKSLCDDVITPFIQWIIGMCTGAKSIDEMTKALNVGPIQFGAFISAIINFIIMAFIIFILVKVVNKAMTLGKKKEEEEEEETEKECPYCLSKIDINATRCPHCTSKLEGFEEK